MNDVKMADHPPRRVIGLPHRGAYAEIGSTFERIGALLGEQKLWPEATEVLGVYFDDPDEVATEDLRAFAGVAVREDLPLPPGLEQIRLASGRFAVLVHRGHYSGLPAAWDWIRSDWLPKSGVVLRSAPSLEIYRNSAMNVPEFDLLTEICVAVD